MCEGLIDWAGVSFTAVHHRDGHFFREPGLFAFARSHAGQGAVLLFAGQSENLARDAGPTHSAWGESLRLGMNELHICRPMPRRVDRLELLARIVRRAQPILNVLEEATTAEPEGLEPARRRA